MEMQGARLRLAAPGSLGAGDTSSAGTWPRSHSTPVLLLCPAGYVCSGRHPRLDDAHSGGRWKGWQRWVPSSSSPEDQHRQGLSQALPQEQNILPQLPQGSWSQQ